MIYIYIYTYVCVIYVYILYIYIHIYIERVAIPTNNADHGDSKALKVFHLTAT